MIKKIICMINGHKLKTQKCPFTKAELVTCSRCSPNVHKSKMSFN